MALKTGKVSSLTLGVVGLPNVGKSSLFNLLTNKTVEAANYPFCTIDPNHGLHVVKDNNLEILKKYKNSQRIIPSDVRVVDIAGLVKGASEGAGLGNKFLSNIRECSSLLHVVRCFDNSQVAHVMETVDVRRDVDVIDIELCLADFNTVENVLAKKKTLSVHGITAADGDILLKQLSDGKSIRKFVHNLKPQLQEFVNSIQLLTVKPLMFVGNIDEMQASSLMIGESVKEVEDLKALALELSADSDNKLVVKCVPVGLEQELNDINTLEEKRELLEMYGLENCLKNELGLNSDLTFACDLGHPLLETLNLTYYYTVGEKEARTWLMPKDSNARVAASRVHSDIGKGLIRAIHYSMADVNEHLASNKGTPIKTTSLTPDSLVPENSILEFLHS